MQRQASSLLAAEGLQVVTVSNGVAAIKKLPAVRPDLILADVEMPGKNGYEVCEFVKNSAEIRHIPVLLIFSELEPYEAGRGEQVGADGCVQKPFQHDSLIAAVTQHLARTEIARSSGPPPPPTSVDSEPTASAEPAESQPAEPPPAPEFNLAALSEGVALVEPSHKSPQAAQQEDLQSVPYAAGNTTAEGQEESSAGEAPADAPEPLVQTFAAAGPVEAGEQEAMTPASSETSSFQPSSQTDSPEPAALEITSFQPSSQTDEWEAAAENPEPLTAAPQAQPSADFSPELSASGPQDTPPGDSFPAEFPSLPTYRSGEAQAADQQVAPGAEPDPSADLAEEPTPAQQSAEQNQSAIQEESLPPAEPETAEGTTAAAIDPELLYAIVHKVVLKMAPPALEQHVLEDIARQIASELATEFGSDPA